jgi:hypothetical protein
VLEPDHVIRDAASFRQAVEAGMAAAKAGQLVTFDIVPTAPETGYGYIEATEALSQGSPAPAASLKPVRFVEKPDRTQDVMTIAGLQEREGASESKANRRIYRPWGSYDGITEGDRWQVKKIVVNPGVSLSLQMHHHRVEHWIVVKSKALLEKVGAEELLGENQSFTSRWAANTASPTRLHSSGYDRSAKRNLPEQELYISLQQWRSQETRENRLAEHHTKGHATLESLHSGRYRPQTITYSMSQ